MKEDHIVAGILTLLIAALLLGAISSANSNGITSGAVSIPGASSMGAVFLIAVILIALMSGTYGIYQLYFRGKFRKPVKSTSIGPLDLSLDRSGMIRAPEMHARQLHEDPNVGKLRSYIKTQRLKGEPDSNIRMKLKSVGWGTNLIEKAFK